NAVGHLYLFEPAERYLAGMPVLLRTRDGGSAPATYF
ncbi:hypothetical protein GlitD10_2231, partial [Gloeomargarita lithophora Alchichica-D10]